MGLSAESSDSKTRTVPSIKEVNSIMMYIFLNEPEGLNFFSSRTGGSFLNRRGHLCRDRVCFALFSMRLFSHHCDFRSIGANAEGGDEITGNICLDRPQLQVSRRQVVVVFP